MPTSTNVTNLKINELTEAQFDSAVSGGVIGANELSVITDLDESIQVSTMPTASATELDKIYQFVGTTDANYTNGYFYKCVSDGATPPVYSWSNIQVQASSGGLPSQTGNAGKFLITDGTDASWGKSVDTELNITHNTSSYSSYGGKINFYKQNSKVAIINAAGNGELEFMNGSGSGCKITGFSEVKPRTGGTLGDGNNNNSRWANVYTAKINAGSGAGDITVPTVAGSMAVQVSTVPTASSTLEGQIYQYIGATDSTYTNGRFYKCVSDGQSTPTYSWEEVQLGGGSSLPSQTGNAGKFLTTDGTDASWATINALQNTATGIDSLTILGTAANGMWNVNAGVGSNCGNNKGQNVAVGASATTTSERCVVVGQYATIGSNCDYTVVVGRNASAQNSQQAVAVGSEAKVRANRAIQIGAGTNSTANTVCFGNANGNYEIMSADGTVPADRLVHAINKYSTMPTAASTNEGWIVQFTGTTDSTYTHGHLYECVSDGGNPATYSWTEVQLGGGGSSYTAGTGIDITSGVISVTNPTLQNNATGSNSVVVGRSDTSNHPTNTVVIGGGSGTQSAFSVAIGHNSSTNTSSSIAVGASTSAMNQAVAIGFNANAKKSIQISCGTSSSTTNSDANTFKVANANGNYEIMSADGTIPTARLTKVNSTITLTAAGWSSNTQTVTVNGVTSTSVVLVAPDPSDTADYVAAGILCTSQATNSLTFTATTTPTTDIDVNIVCL